jgi:hypothetical protein
MTEIKIYLDSVEIGSTLLQTKNTNIIERNSIHTFIKEIDDLVGKDNWTSFEYRKDAE